MRINKKKLMEFFQGLSGDDGGYHEFLKNGKDTKSDARFTYCVVAVSKILQLEVCSEKVAMFLETTKSFDGGYGVMKNAESHGGYTFCAIATLFILQKLPQNCSDVVKWCVMRQRKGFCGRVNKEADTCYSFWIGGTLKLLGFENLINDVNEDFLLEMQDNGFKRDFDSTPDVMHTYLSLAALQKTDLSVEFNVRKCLLK